MMPLLRQELQELMGELPLPRKPALRRAQEDEWLLASDLPLLVSGEALHLFCVKTGQHGWQTHRMEDGWLRFDHPVPLPVSYHANWDVVQEEIACLISLLRRHPSDEKDAAFLRRLCKTDEVGQKALQGLLTEAHQEWAERLRAHRPLPAAVLPYLEAMRDEPV